MQNIAGDQIVCIVDGVPAIGGQSNCDQPIDERRPIESLFVQTAVREPIRPDGRLAIVQMVADELFANEFRASIVVHGGRSLPARGGLNRGPPIQFHPIASALLEQLVRVGDEAGRHQNRLAEIQKRFQERKFNVNARHPFHDQRPHGQRNGLEWSAVS